MIKTKHLVFILCLFSVFNLNAQGVSIHGKVIANEDIEGIHIINQTASRYTTTDHKGQFIIPAKLNDTILISGVKYQKVEIVISTLIIESKVMSVYLIENINELDEVVIGKILTGNLLSDIENAEVESDINFYDLGIPGYTGKQKTQSERRLQEASDLDATAGGSLGGAGGSVSLGALINAITGRTKKLKNIVRLESQDICMNAAISEFAELLFIDDTLEAYQQAEFFYYATEDEQFLKLCKLDNELQMFDFLKLKLVEFEAQLLLEKD